MNYQRPIGLTTDFFGSDRSKKPDLSDTSSQMSSPSTINNNTSTNSFCDLNINNEFNSENETLDDLDFNDDLTLKTGKIDLVRKPIFDPKYHSIPIYIEQPKIEKKHKRISDLKKSHSQRPEKVKFSNVNYLHYTPELVHKEPMRPLSTPCPPHLPIRQYNTIQNFRNLSEYDIKNFSETDTDDYLSHIRTNRPKYQRKRPFKKSMTLRQISHTQSNRLSDLMVQNTSIFMDSPIHLLMNYQQNLKKQNAIVQKPAPITEEFDYEPLNLDFKPKYCISLILVSVLIYSLVSLYEALANILNTNVSSLMFFKLGCALISLFYVILYAFRSNGMCKNMEKKRKYFNLYKSNYVDCQEDEASLLRDSENSDISINHRDNLIVRSSSQLNELHSLENLNRNANTTKRLKYQNENFIFNQKVRFKFSSFVIGLVIANVSILGIFLTSYFNKLAAREFLINTSLSALCAIGFCIFLNNIIITLLEMSYKNNELKNSGIIVCQIEIDDKYSKAKSLFQKQHFRMIKNLEKLILKLLICIQLSFVFVPLIIYYMNNLTVKDSLDRVMNQVCMDSIINFDHLYCSKLIVKNKFFNWYEEIAERKIIFILRAKKLNNIIQERFFNGLESDGFKNQSDIVNDITYATIDDFYLFLISVSLLILFVALTITFSCVKQRKIERKTDKINEDNYSNNKREGASYSSKRGVFILHLSMVFLFYQGFVKTIFFNEVNKWFTGCISDSSHLTNLLLFYALISFISITFLSMLIIFCNLKRKLIFFLVFVQQLTLLIMLFYWDPAKPNETSSHIDYAFFGCFAICENLWLILNLRNLLKKSNDMEKSPIVVLLYGFSIFSLGSFCGYGASVYLCYPIKLYLSIILLIIFSLIHILNEFYFSKKYFKN